MAGDPAKKLATLLKRCRAAHPEASAPVVPLAADGASDPIVRELIFSMMLWECSTAQALDAFARVHAAFVDENELRVAYAADVAGVLGEGYPLALERATRLRAALMDVYKREHQLSLRQHVESAKRDAKGYVATLEGLPGFVRARLLLLWWDAHAIPVDDRLASLLRDEGVIGAEASAAEAASFLERNVRAGEARGVHTALQAWSDAAGTPGGVAPRASVPGKGGRKASGARGTKRTRSGS